MDNATLNLLHLYRCSPQAQLGALMVILREHIAHMETEELNAQQTELTTFFLTALDFRAEHCQVSSAPEGFPSSPRRLCAVGVSLLAALIASASVRTGQPGRDGGCGGQRDRLPARHGDEAVRGHVQAALLQGNDG